MAHHPSWRGANGKVLQAQLGMFRARSARGNRFRTRAGVALQSNFELASMIDVTLQTYSRGRNRLCSTCCLGLRRQAIPVAGRPRHRDSSRVSRRTAGALSGAPSA